MPEMKKLGCLRKTLYVLHTVVAKQHLFVIASETLKALLVL